MATLEELYGLQFLEGSDNLYRDADGTIRNARQADGRPVPGAPPVNAGFAGATYLSPQELMGMRPGELNAALKEQQQTAQFHQAARFVDPREADRMAAEFSGMRAGDRAHLESKVMPIANAMQAAQSQQQAAEMQAYRTADYLSQFLPPERVVSEVARLTGVNLGDKLASTPKMMERRKAESDLATAGQSRVTQSREQERKDRELAMKSAEMAREAAAKDREAYIVSRKEYQGLDNAIGGLNRLEDLAAKLRESEGLSRATGMMSYVPSRRGGAAADFEANLKSLKAQIGFGALQAMRDASKTGGALGNVSNIELDLLQNSLAAIDLAQSPEQMRQSLDTIIAQTRRLRQAALGAYFDANDTPAGALSQRDWLKLKPGQVTKFPNGQHWTMDDMGRTRRLR